MAKPNIPNQKKKYQELPDGTPSMSAQMIAKALECALKAIVENEEDIKSIGGEIH